MLPHRRLRGRSKNAAERVSAIGVSPGRLGLVKWADAYRRITFVCSRAPDAATAMGEHTRRFVRALGFAAVTLVLGKDRAGVMSLEGSFWKSSLVWSSALLQVG